MSFSTINANSMRVKNVDVRAIQGFSQYEIKALSNKGFEHIKEKYFENLLKLTSNVEDAEFGKFKGNLTKLLMHSNEYESMKNRFENLKKDHEAIKSQNFKLAQMRIDAEQKLESERKMLLKQKEEQEEILDSITKEADLKVKRYKSAAQKLKRALEDCKREELKAKEDAVEWRDLSRKYMSDFDKDRKELLKAIKDEQEKVAIANKRVVEANEMIKKGADTVREIWTDFREEQKVNKDLKKIINEQSVRIQDLNERVSSNITEVKQIEDGYVDKSGQVVVFNPSKPYFGKTMKVYKDGDVWKIL